jgi:hypothetical protein
MKKLLNKNNKKMTTQLKKMIIMMAVAFFLCATVSFGGRSIAWEVKPKGDPYTDIDFVEDFTDLGTLTGPYTREEDLCYATGEDASHAHKWTLRTGYIIRMSDPATTENKFEVRMQFKEECNNHANVDSSMINLVPGKMCFISSVNPDTDNIIIRGDICTSSMLLIYRKSDDSGYIHWLIPIYWFYDTLITEPLTRVVKVADSLPLTKSPATWHSPDSQYTMSVIQGSKRGGPLCIFEIGPYVSPPTDSTCASAAHGAGAGAKPL